MEDKGYLSRFVWSGPFLWQWACFPLPGTRSIFLVGNVREKKDQGVLSASAVRQAPSDQGNWYVKVAYLGGGGVLNLFKCKCGVGWTRSQRPFLPLAGCATLGDLLIHSVPHLVHLLNEDNNNTCLSGPLWGLSEMTKTSNKVAQWGLHQWSSG